MREYTIKIVIALIGLYILFKITIGAVINTYAKKMKSLTDYSQRTEIKEKWKKELIKKIFSAKMKELLSQIF